MGFWSPTLKAQARLLAQIKALTTLMSQVLRLHVALADIDVDTWLDTALH